MIVSQSRYIFLLLNIAYTTTTKFKELADYYCDRIISLFFFSFMESSA